MSRILPRRINVLVASFGGVGTTFLADFIGRWQRTNDRDDRDGFKHLCIPPVSWNPRVRFVYVFGDPVLATISLFRRGYQVEQSRKLLLCAERGFEPLVPGVALADYAAAGVDRLRFEEHFDNWATRYAHHPTLFIRHEALWDRAADLVRFLHLPPAAVDAFPAHRSRRSDPASLPPPVLRDLEELYGDFRRRLTGLGDCFVRGRPPRRRSPVRSASFRAFLQGGAVEQLKFASRRHLPGLHAAACCLLGGLPIIGRHYGRKEAVAVRPTPQAGPR